MAAGALAACLVAAGWKPGRRVSALLIIAILLAYAVATKALLHASPLFYRTGFTVTALAFGFLIVALIQRPPVFPFSHPALVWVGRRSYGLYVYHLPIFEALERVRIPGNYWNLAWVTILRFVLSFLAACLSYRYLEKPFLRLKERFRSPVPIAPFHARA